MTVCAFEPSNSVYESTRESLPYFVSSALRGCSGSCGPLIPAQLRNIDILRLHDTFFDCIQTL